MTAQINRDVVELASHNWHPDNQRFRISTILSGIRRDHPMELETDPPNGGRALSWQLGDLRAFFPRSLKMPAIARRM